MAVLLLGHLCRRIDREWTSRICLFSEEANPDRDEYVPHQLGNHGRVVSSVNHPKQGGAHG